MMASEFVLRQQHKPRRRPRKNDISVLRPSSKDLELIAKLKEFLPVVEDLLKYCRDGPVLRSRTRTHYVEKEKVYVYRYLEVEDWYGRVLFRAREDSPLAREAEGLVMLHNALRSVCDALRTIAHDAEFALRLQNKLGPQFAPDLENKLQSR